MPTRRQFLTHAGSTLAVSAMSSAATPSSPPLLRFGLSADCQYADVAPAGKRFYRQSLRKLQEAVTELNRHDLAFSFHLGDFIDRDFESFEALAPIAAGLNSPLHHLLGNHDFEVADEHKAAVPAKLGLDQPYYSFRRAGFRFVILDTNEVSVYRHPSDDPRTAAARVELEELRAAGVPGAKPWNGRPGATQLAWLKKELQEATAARESVLVFGHHPVLPGESHAIWNHTALTDLFRAFPCVKAYLNGHNHAGAYVARDGCHYLTLDGMLDTKDTNAFGHAALYADRLVVTGFGRQPSHTLQFEA